MAEHTAKLVIKNTSTPGASPEPDFIDLGELALNYADEKLFFKNIVGEIVEIGGEAQTFIYRYEYNNSNNYQYFGKALTDSLESDSVWRITKLTFNADGGIDNNETMTESIWDDRSTIFGSGPQ